MNVLSANQRRSERQQTFYTAYAYTCQGSEWRRLDVKIFDQSGQGVRLRSMENLEGEKLYLQLDPTSSVLVDCTIRRSQPVARNCWEFGLELDELVEMQEALPKEVLEAYGVNDTTLTEEVAVEAAVSTPPQAADSLDTASPMPGMDTTSTAPSSESDQLTEDVAVEAVAVEAVVAESPQAADSLDTAPSMPGMDTTSAAPPSESDQLTEDIAVEAIAVEAVVPEPPQPADSLAPALPVPSDITALPDHQPNQLAVDALPMPSMVKTKAGFVETVMVGFAGLASLFCEFAVKGAKMLRFIIGANVQPGSFFSNKTEEAQRLEWLQACSKSVCADRTEGLNWTESSATSPE